MFLENVTRPFCLFSPPLRLLRCGTPVRWPMLTIPEDELDVEEPGESSTPIPEELPIEVPNHPRDLRAALAAGAPDPVNDASNDPLAWTSGLASGANATTFEEAKASPCWKQWQAALLSERKSLEARGVWNQIETLDVVTAFLYPLLMEEMYMVLPPGIADYPGEMVRLLRSIYGEDYLPVVPSLLSSDSRDGLP